MLHAELRGSAVALKSLRTGTKPSFGTHNSAGAYSGSAKGTAGAGTTSTYNRYKNAFFAFIDTAYAQVEDEERRGLLRLKRAFQQASRVVAENEAKRKKELQSR